MPNQKHEQSSTCVRLLQPLQHANCALQLLGWSLVQVQMLHVDADVGPVTVMFSGAKEPIAAAGQTAVFGKLAVARQVTAPPETYKRRLDVGRCRDVEIEVRCLCHRQDLPCCLS